MILRLRDVRVVMTMGALFTSFSSSLAAHVFVFDLLHFLLFLCFVVSMSRRPVLRGSSGWSLLTGKLFIIRVTAIASIGVILSEPLGSRRLGVGLFVRVISRGVVVSSSATLLWVSVFFNSAIEASRSIEHQRGPIICHVHTSWGRKQTFI